MAKNRARHLGRKLHLSVAAINGSGAGDLCKSGDPGVVGQLPVVCLTDEDGNGFASVDTMGVYRFAVPGGVGGVAVGGYVSWDNAAGALAAGDANRFGIALGAVAAGVTTEIEVRVGRA